MRFAKIIANPLLPPNEGLLRAKNHIKEIKIFQILPRKNIYDCIKVHEKEGMKNMN